MLTSEKHKKTRILSGIGSCLYGWIVTTWLLSIWVHPDVLFCHVQTETRILESRLSPLRGAIQVATFLSVTGGTQIDSSQVVTIHPYRHDHIPLGILVLHLSGSCKLKALLLETTFCLFGNVLIWLCHALWGNKWVHTFTKITLLRAIKVGWHSSISLQAKSEIEPGHVSTNMCSQLNVLMITIYKFSVCWWHISPISYLEKLMDHH